MLSRYCPFFLDCNSLIPWKSMVSCGSNIHFGKISDKHQTCKILNMGFIGAEEDASVTCEDTTQT